MGHISSWRRRQKFSVDIGGYGPRFNNHPCRRAPTDVETDTAMRRSRPTIETLDAKRHHYRGLRREQKKCGRFKLSRTQPRSLPDALPNPSYRNAAPAREGGGGQKAGTRDGERGHPGEGVDNFSRSVLPPQRFDPSFLPPVSSTPFGREAPRGFGTQGDA